MTTKHKIAAKIIDFTQFFKANILERFDSEDFINIELMKNYFLKHNGLNHDIANCIYRSSLNFFCFISVFKDSTIHTLKFFFLNPVFKETAKFLEFMFLLGKY